MSIAARRTSASGTFAARDTASTITPSRAPCRISPISRPRRKSCSAAEARAKRSWRAVRRAAWEPAPAVAPILRSAVSTSMSSSAAGADPGGGRSFSEAHPTPIDPCGRTPDRYATAIGTSSGRSAASREERRSTFVRRDEVAATSADAATTSVKSITLGLSEPRASGIPTTNGCSRSSPRLTSVETSGLEPPTPCLRSRCWPNPLTSPDAAADTSKWTRLSRLSLGLRMSSATFSSADAFAAEPTYQTVAESSPATSSRIC